MKAEDQRNEARSVKITVDPKLPKALQALSEIKDFQVATEAWDWKVLFGFCKPQKINWKVYKIEGPGGVELSPSDKIFASVDKIDSNMKDLKVSVVQAKKAGGAEQNGEVVEKKGAKSKAAKSTAIKLPKSKQAVQAARRSTPVRAAPTPKPAKTPKTPKSSAKDNKSPVKNADVGVQSPKPNGNLGTSTPASSKKPKAQKKDTKGGATGGAGTPKSKLESGPSTMVLGLPKKVDEKIPSVGLVLGQAASSPAAGGGAASGSTPSQPKKAEPKKRKGARDEGDVAAGAPPAKKKAAPKPKAGDAPAPGSSATNPADAAPKKAPKPKKPKAGESRPPIVAGTVTAAPSASASMAERIAMLSRDPTLSLPISRPATGTIKSPPANVKNAKKPTSAAGVQGINSRFNGYVDPSVAADIIAECKKIKENPEARNFLRQRAAYIYNMVMHVFLNE